MCGLGDRKVKESLEIAEDENLEHGQMATSNAGESTKGFH